MTQKTTPESHSEAEETIHQYYMDIINCMPNIVYWVDMNCVLKGCNNNFVKLLGLKSPRDFVGTPYEQLKKFGSWPSARIEAFRLDDMAVIFAGKPQYYVVESPVIINDLHPLYYLATRVPLFDKQKQVMGLVVILTDVTKQHINETLNVQKSKAEVKHILPDVGVPIRALMVEDNYIAQKVEKALLETLGCQVDIASSGEAALKLFEPGKYQIVFMDIGLQDTSGYIVAKKMRENEKNTDFHVPIIALTSYQADVVKYDCRDYLMDGVITKPLTSEQAKQILQYYVYYEKVEITGLLSGLSEPSPAA